MTKDSWPLPEQPEAEPERAFAPNGLRNAWFGTCTSARFGGAARLIRDKSGVAAIEYAILCALIGLAIVTGVTQVGGEVSESYTHVEEEVAKATGNKGGNGKGHGGDKDGDGVKDNGKGSGK